MPDDRQLLRRFAADRSEAAFGELVARHVSLVHSVALRQTNGDAHFAQDIAQIVFADLARKAPALSENVVLAGWLHRATIFAARQILRGERRRRAREQEAVTMNAIQSETGNENWRQIRPLLDEALERLTKTDRDALLLRFFEQQSLAQVGATLGGSEDATRKRINRALEKLHKILTGRGVTTTAAALSTVISANAIQVAPAGLAATLTSSSMAFAGTETTLTFLKIMTMTKLKLGISALAIVGATTALVVQHQTQIKLREENESLRQQMVRQITQQQADNESLSNRLAATYDFKKLPDDSNNELLKLRGEVGVLQRQANEANQKAQIAGQKLATVLSAQAKFTAHETATVDNMKELGLAMLLYAMDNNGQFPTNAESLKKELPPQNFGDYFSFEFVNAGVARSINNPEHANMLELRERITQQAPDGTWHRIYGFADGSVQTAISYDGNFDAWEKANTYSPPPNQ